MPFLRTSMALAVLFFSAFGSPTLALALTLEEANALEEAARTSYENQADWSLTVSAYERALAAYDELGEQQKSLQMLNQLIFVSERACEIEPAIGWAQTYLDRISGTDGLRSYSEVVMGAGRLARLLAFVEQFDSVTSTFAQAEDYLTQLERSVTALDSIGGAAALWNARAGLVATHLSLLPAAADAAAPSDDAIESLGQKLLTQRRTAGAITQVDGLLRDVDQIHQGDLRVEGLNVALQLSRQYRYSYGELKALTGLSHQAIQTGNYADAIDYAQQAQTLAQQMQDSQSVQILTRYLLAQSEQALGHAEAAILNHLAVLTALEEQSRHRLRVWSIDIPQSELVPTLVSLYRQVGQPALASQLETEYRNSLSIPRLASVGVPTRPFSRSFLARPFPSTNPLQYCAEDATRFPLVSPLPPRL